MTAEDEHDRLAEDQEAASKRATRRLREASAIYKQSITSLWLANGGASAAVLSFIAVTFKEGALKRQLLVPFAFFIAGLICMELGTIIFLINETSVIRALESARNWLDIPANLAKRPSEKAGLSFYDPRTVTALLAAALFVTGCFVGLLELFICPT